MAGRYDDALTEFEMAVATATGRSTGTADVWSAAIAWHRQDPPEAHRLFEQAAGKPMGMNRCESALRLARRPANACHRPWRMRNRTSPLASQPAEVPADDGGGMTLSAQDRISAPRRQWLA